MATLGEPPALSIVPFGTDEDRRLFAAFVARETRHAAAPDQPQGEAAIPADILRLSLESLRDHLSLAAGARRADGQAFRAYPAYFGEGERGRRARGRPAPDRRLCRSRRRLL